MIILTSNGLSSDKLLNEVKKVVPLNARAAIVTTASVGYKEKDWHIPRLTNELEQIGLSVTCFDIEHEEPQLLLHYDVVELIGGNPFYLLNQMHIQGAEAIFSEIAKHKVLIGISGGSAVLQKTIGLIAQYSPEMNEAVQLTDLTGLSLTDIEILPHYERFKSRFDRFEERAKEYERANNCSVIRLNDGEGIFISEAGSYKI
jgi:dipeptidase E